MIFMTCLNDKCELHKSLFSCFELDVKCPKCNQNLYMLHNGMYDDKTEDLREKEKFSSNSFI